VVQPTTAAQYFHVLRRQMHRSVRKPLIVMTPKSLLRARVAQSTADELAAGHFNETLDDRGVEEPENVRLIHLSTGKIAYALMDERSKRDVPTAVVRIEQLYPFPLQQLQDIFDRYPMADEVRWVQEEPENMGAWFFVQARLHDKLRDGLRLSHASRAESASPASGSLRIHEQEHAHLMEAAFEGLV
jgi:2-oxoglutarate dehydrogenase E1 component